MKMATLNDLFPQLFELFFNHGFIAERYLPNLDMLADPEANHHPHRRGDR